MLVVKGLAFFLPTLCPFALLNLCLEDSYAQITMLHGVIAIRLVFGPNLNK